MKMQTRRRTLLTKAFGVILSLTMAAAMIPGAVSLRAAAEDGATEITTEATVTTQAVSSWDQLSSAVSNAAINVSTTISIEDDITVLEQMEISSEKDITIKLNGHTLDANNQCRLFSVESGGQLTIICQDSVKGTLKGGHAGDGGAIENSGILIITNVYITDNYASGCAGAIHNKGTATLKNVQITNNRTFNDGGGAIDNKGTLTLDDCVISNNTAGGSGGGIYNTGELNMISGAIKQNISGSNAGGIYNLGSIYLQGKICINSNTIGGYNKDNLLKVGGSIIINDNIDGSDISVSFGGDYPSMIANTANSTIKIPTGAFVADNTDDNCIKIKDNKNDNTQSVRIGKKYKVEFISGNDNGGTMEPDYVIQDEEYTLPECKFTPRDGYFFAGWEINGDESTLKQPGDVINSGYKGISAKAIWKEGGCVTAASLTLNGDIGVNLYFKVADSLASDSDAYMTIQGPNDAAPVNHPLSELEKSGDCYVASINVNSAQMAEKITYELYDGQNNKKTIWYSNRKDSTETFTYSVNDYIDVVKDNETQSKELRDLVTAMQNYGAWARQYLIGRGQIPENTPILSTPLNNIGDVDVSSYAAIKSEGFRVPDLTMSLLLESKNSIRLYYSGDQITVSVDDSSAKIDTGKKGDKYFVEITDISAQDLDKKYTITFEGGYGAIEVCALSYAYNVLSAYGSNSEKQDICNTVKALYEYNQAAKAYFTTGGN